MKTTNAGLRALTTSKERQEIRAVGSVPLELEYLEGSREPGLEYGIDTALYNVRAPKVPGYKYGPHSGIPTLCRETLLKYFPVEVVDAGIKNAKSIRQGYLNEGELK